MDCNHVVRLEIGSESWVYGDDLIGVFEDVAASITRLESDDVNCGCLSESVDGVDSTPTDHALVNVFKIKLHRTSDLTNTNMENVEEMEGDKDFGSIFFKFGDEEVGKLLFG